MKHFYLIAVVFLYSSAMLFSQDFNNLNNIQTNPTNSNSVGYYKYLGSDGKPLFQNGTIYIKLKSTSSINLREFDKHTQKLYSKSFGLKNLDRISKKYSINKIEQAFISPKVLSKKISQDKIQASSNLYGINRIYTVTFDENIDPLKLAAEFSTLPEVEYAEPVPLYYECEIPNDTRYSEQQHLVQMMCPAAWDIHKGENNPVLVGINDSGVDWKHPDLVNNLYQNLGEDADGDGYVIEYIDGQWQFDPGDVNGVDDDGNGFADDFVGWNFYPDDGSTVNDPWASTANQHGTHVAGISAGSTNNNFGIASISWNVKFLPTKHGSNAGLTYIYNAFDGIKYLAEMGADVINCSWGGGGYSQAGQDIMNYAYSLGTVIIAAAGNNNSQALFYPAAYKNVVSVSSVASTDKKAYYSNYGYYVDIAAPGGDAYVDGGILSTIPGNSYAKFQGTSMASPQITGMYALLKSYLPATSNEALIRRMLGNTDKIDSINPSYVGKLGYGRVNAYKTLLQDFTGKFPLKLDLRSVQSQKIGETYNIGFEIFNYSMDGANQVRFTISTSDPNLQIINNQFINSVSAEGTTFTTLSTSLKILNNINSTATIHLHLEGIDNEIVAGKDFDFIIYLGSHGIFVYEKYSNGPTTSGSFIRDYLNTNGYQNIVYSNTLPQNLIGYDVVFLSNGNGNSYDFSYFDNTQATMIKNFLTSGGRVYLESSEALGYEQVSDIELLDLFGLSSADDGLATHTFGGLVGGAGSVADGMAFPTTTQTYRGWEDRFSPSTGQIVFNENNYGIVSVQNSGSYNQKTIVFSYALSKLNDQAPPSTRNNLLQNIMNFFEIYNQPPAQVALLTPTNNSSYNPYENIPFSWEVANKAWNYTIEISEMSDFSTILYSQTTENTALTINYDVFQPSTTYYWRVKASNNIGDGLWSETWTFTVTNYHTDQVILNTPTNNATLSTTTPLVMWNYAYLADDYQLQVASDPSFINIIYDVKDIADIKYHLSSIPLNHNTTYYWRVRGENEQGFGKWSDTWNFLIYLCPGTVTLINPTNNSVDLDIQFTFEWTEDPLADSYILQIAKDANFLNIVNTFSNIITNEYELTDELNYNQQYFWRVRSVNNCGEGLWSGKFKFKTKTIPFQINLTDKSTCKGNSISLGTFDEDSQLITVTGGSGDFSYQWIPNYNMQNANTGNPTVVNPTSSQTYTLTVKDNQTLETKSASLFLTVNTAPKIQLPIFVFLKLGSFINLNDQIISITGGAPPYSKYWEDNNGNRIAEPPLVSPPLGSNYYYLFVSDNNNCSSSKRLIIYVRTLKDFVEENATYSADANILLIAYPAPFSDKINIIAEFDNQTSGTIEVSNLIGQKVYSENFANSNNIDKQLYLNNLSSGVYILTIYTNQGVISQTIIKE
ncbi:MAG TPA: S8/S53 family peptidase [Candidatus Kapabacteria bacterium]|nr:S8/S53 family peptidase [Candidatus Kapabacteria bacterium]